jgi:hypothetical protein
VGVLESAYEPLYNRDWLSATLKRSRLTPLGAGLILAALNLLLNSLLAYRSGTWLSGPAGMGLLDDYQVLVFAGLFQPTVMATFCWLPRGIQRLYTGIAKEAVFESEESLKLSYAGLRKRLQGPFLVPVALVWAVWSCFAEYYIFFHPLISSWIQAQPQTFWLRLPLDFLFNFMLAMGFYNFMVILAAVRKVFRENPIRVQPFHPDHAGGLGAVGRFTANIGYAVGAVGLFLTIVLFQRPPGTALLYNLMIGFMFAIYFVMAPIGFYFPLWSAHDAMLSVRDALARDISSEFDAVHARLGTLRSKDAETNEPLLKRLRQLDEERNLLDRYPVWPFDASSLRKFFGLALSPLVPILTSLFIDTLSKWLP